MWDLNLLDPMKAGNFTTTSLHRDLCRRAFLLCGAASAAPILVNDKAYARAVSPDLRTLTGFMDVLLPGDEISPPASSLATADALLGEVVKGSMAERLIGAGTAFLERVGPVSFVDLPSAVQAEIVEWMSSADYNAIPGRFYHIIRLFTVAYYYSHPSVVASFPLNSAPQPTGYPPPWRPT